jgi:hypothetical protein
MTVLTLLSLIVRIRRLYYNFMSAVVLMSLQCISMSQSVWYVLPKLQFLFASLPWLVLLATHLESIRV